LLRWSYESSAVKFGQPGRVFDKLQQSRKRDFYLGSTTVGPHRDDLQIVLNDRPTRDYASQGEAKSATLAIKFAIFDFLAERLRESPILLLDELSSDLDLTRLAALTQLLPALGQVFLTTTKTGGTAAGRINTGRNQNRGRPDQGIKLLAPECSKSLPFFSNNLYRKWLRQQKRRFRTRF